MHCQYCNAELTVGVSFCDQCGKPVAAGAPEVSSNVHESTTYSGEQFGSYTQVPDYPGHRAGPGADPYSHQPGYASRSYYQGMMPASQFNVQPPYAAAQQSRVGLWIILGTVGAHVLSGGIILNAVLASMNSPTPTSTLNAFCIAIKSGDYQTAYHEFSCGVQSQIAEAQFAAAYSSNIALGKITNCTVSNTNDAAGSGTISYTCANSGRLVDDYTLVNQSGAWKINSQQPRSSLTLTLLTYCTALKSGDYQTAYNQQSSTAQSQISETRFANRFMSDTVSNCTVSNINDTAGTGTISFAYADGRSGVVDFTLVDENGAWKIDTGLSHL